MIGASIHGVSRIRVETYYPANARSVTLNVDTENYGTISLTLFDMPENEAMRVVKSLSDAETIVYEDGGDRCITATEYLNEKRVFEVIECSKPIHEEA